MSYTKGFGKLERGVWSNDRLPADVRIARIQFKQQIRTWLPQPPTEFENYQNVLPQAGNGQTYYEYQVGEATAPTEEFPTLRGRRRLVALADAGRNVLKMYFSDDHYAAGSWVELEHP